MIDEFELGGRSSMQHDMVVHPSGRIYSSGGVWTSNSNAPAWQIETGIPRIVRLQPDGQVPAPAAHEK